MASYKALRAMDGLKSLPPQGGYLRHGAGGLGSEAPTASWGICTLMTLSNMLGTSLLTAPSILSQWAGLRSLALLMGAALLSLAGLNFLAVVSCHLPAGNASFLLAARQARLQWAAKSFDVIVFTDSFISLIALSVLSGDAATPLVRLVLSGATREWTIVALVALIFTPLSLVRFLNTLRGLAKVSLVSVAYIFFLSVVLTIRGSHPPPSDFFFSVSFLPNLQGNLTFRAMVKSFTLLFTIFTCHLNFFTISNELCHHSCHRLQRVAVVSTIGAVLMVGGLAVGITGFAWSPMSPLLPTDSIRVFPENSWGLIARLSYFIVAAARFPLYAHPCRRSLMLLLGCEESHAGAESLRIRHILSTLLLVAVSTSMPMFVHSFGFVIGLIGALCKFSLACIAPPVLFLRLCCGKEEVGPPMWQRVCAVLLLLFGVFATPVSLASVISLGV